VTVIVAGRSGDRILVGARDFSVLNVQTGSRAHPASYSVGTGVLLWVLAFFPGVKGLGREANHLHLVPRLSVSETIPALHAFMPLHFLIASVFCMGGFAGRSV
jgi:hypothetical protein